MTEPQPHAERIQQEGVSVVREAATRYDECYGCGQTFAGYVFYAIHGPHGPTFEMDPMYCAGCARVLAESLNRELAKEAQP